LRKAKGKKRHAHCVEHSQFYPRRVYHHPLLAVRHAGEYYGNEAVHVDVLRPESKSALLNTGGTFLNIFWLIFFGWWLCLTHISTGIVQCISIIGIPVGLANFKIAAIALWPVGRRVVSVEEARAARDASARRRY